MFRPVPVEYRIEGYFFLYQKHYAYWKTSDGRAIGMVTVLHGLMHQFNRLLEKIDFIPH